MIVNRQFRICSTKAQGEAQASIPPRTIRRSTTEEGFRRCILGVHHSPRGFV